jgi:hypothetical protein
MYEVRMKNELEHVRDWAKGEIQAGRVPPSSWEQHVKLIEAADALLHDISVMPSLAQTARRPTLHLHAIRGGRH